MPEYAHIHILPVSNIGTGSFYFLVEVDVCIDAWWQSGDVQNMAELRRHDFSDGFAILGTWSQPRRIDNLPESGAVLMSEYGRGSVAVVGDEVRITGNLNLNGAELRPTVGLSILTTEDGNAILVTED